MPYSISARLAPSDSQRELWDEYCRTRCPLLRGRLESQYLYLVDTLARQLSKRLPECVDLGDLVQEGFLGLRRAVERFQPDRAVKFTTYAQSAIWGAMMDSLRRDDFGTRNARRQSTRIQETRDGFSQQFGRPPTDEELALAMGVRQEKLGTIAHWSHVATVSSYASASDGDRRFQLPPDPRTPDPAMEAQRQDLRELILRGFNPQERLLIILYYFEEMSMREIGATLGISESRVSQLHTLLVVRIKADLERKRVEWR